MTLVNPDEPRVLARAYVVTRGKPLEDEAGFTETPLLITTCWIEAQQEADKNKANIFPAYGDEVVITGSCGGCTVYCGPLHPRRKQSKRQSQQSVSC